MEDEVDPGVGISVLAKSGQQVEMGEPLATVRWSDQSRLLAAMDVLTTAWVVGDEPPPSRPLIIEEVR